MSIMYFIAHLPSVSVRHYDERRRGKSTAGPAGPASGVEAVEAVELVLDRQHLEVAESSLRRIVANRPGPHDGPPAGGVRLVDRAAALHAAPLEPPPGPGDRGGVQVEPVDPDARVCPRHRDARVAVPAGEVRDARGGLVEEPLVALLHRRQPLGAEEG